VTALSIPSPPASWSVIHLGPLNVHAYSLWILAGIFFAIWLTRKRWVERGGVAEVIGDVGVWAIPFGIIGGRLYHVITTPAPYFGKHGHPLDAFKIWEGGLGIWGAIALGLLGAYIGCRRRCVSFATFADAAAPGILVAQAIGRIGNYFNQELFGRPTDLPWGLGIDPGFRPTGYAEYATFHPTFLYELLWNLAGAALIIYLDKRFDLRGGRVLWLYVMVYVSGRLWIETVRIDTAVHVDGVRINIFVSVFVLTLGTVMFVLLGRRQQGRERPARSTLATSTSEGSNASPNS